MRIYLSGGIKDLSNEDIHNWRDRCKKIFSIFRDVTFSDPSRRTKQTEKFIVEIDKAEIIKCDILAVKAFPASWGTAMEILFAWEHNIPVVAWIDEEPSPWVIYHSFYSSINFDIFIAYINTLIDNLK